MSSSGEARTPLLILLVLEGLLTAIEYDRCLQNLKLRNFDMLRLLRLFCLAISLSAFAPDPNGEDIKKMQSMLNSERIEHLFGSYGVDVLPIQSTEFPGSRIANLYSLKGTSKVTRTLAIVDYISPVHAQLQKVHSKIVSGESIGFAFKNAGWKVIKKPIYFGEMPLEGPIEKWMSLEKVKIGSLQIYDLHVENSETAAIPYCRIIEIHSPLYLDTGLLKLLYPDQFTQYSVNDHGMKKRILKFLKTEFTEAKSSEVNL